MDHCFIESLEYRERFEQEENTCLEGGFNMSAPDANASHSEMSLFCAAVERVVRRVAGPFPMIEREEKPWSPDALQAIATMLTRPEGIDHFMQQMIESPTAASELGQFACRHLARLNPSFDGQTTLQTFMEAGRRLKVAEDALRTFSTTWQQTSEQR